MTREKNKYFVECIIDIYFELGKVNEGISYFHKNNTEATKEVKMVVEGVYSAKAAIELAKRYDVRMPIIEEVNKVLFEDTPAKEAVTRLMVREKQVENISVDWD